MASLPWALKSNVQSCFSGYLWVPQNVCPHLHSKPITLTFFLQASHLFGGAACLRLCSAVTTGADLLDGGESGWSLEYSASCSTAALASAACRSFRRSSRKQLAQRPMVAAVPEKPQPLAQRAKLKETGLEISGNLDYVLKIEALRGDGGAHGKEEWSRAAAFDGGFTMPLQSPHGTTINLSNVVFNLVDK
nr:hypothetical protein Iba_chr15bCG0560 [Ipomoea batatas]